MKKIIGALILIILLLVLFVGMIFTIGIKSTICVFGFAILLVALVEFAIYLLLD